VLSLINLTSTTPTSSNADGVSEFTLTYPSAAGKSALSVSIPAVDVLGFDPAVKSISTFIDVTDANGEIAAATAALAAEKAAAAAALAAEKAARTAEKAASDAALAAEKTARAADKTTADALLASEKASRAAEKAVTDAALAAEKAARATDKAANDKALATLNTRVAALTKQVTDLKALYNKLAVRFKQPKIN
jgi:hypothetical protein